jgi:threonine dehydratase
MMGEGQEVATMPPFSVDELHDATSIVRVVVPVTPAYAWPLLARRVGADVIVKHENHTPAGSFKVRGGLVYVDVLRRQGRMPPGLVTATRGNHGQSVAIAATQAGIPALIVVPGDNSAEKNAAMEAFGGELIVAGKDFDEARAVAARLASERGYRLVPSFHHSLVLGVATFAYELLASTTDLHFVYVPIGMGSGICGMIAVRDLLGLKTQIIGVVAANAPAFALSVEGGSPVSTNLANTFADGLACRQPQREPLEIISKGAAEIVRVSEDEIAGAVRILYTDTHNVAEGAGAAPLAALMKQRANRQGKRIGIVLSGGNVDMPVLSRILHGETPHV